MTLSVDTLTAVILAGGLGTRLQPHTNSIPKPMVPVLNKPFLEHTLTYLKGYGIRQVILTLNYLSGVIQNYFGDGSNLGIELIYCQEDTPLGTAGAVKNAEKYINGTFLVLNGDIFNTDLDIADMLAFHEQKGAQATISLKLMDNPAAFGVVETDSDSRVTRFIEKPDLEQVTSRWINAGTYLLEPEVLKRVQANRHSMFETNLFPQLIEQGELVYGYCFNGYWLDMGTEEKYLSLNCDLLLSRARSPLFPEMVTNEIRCDSDVSIHPSAKIMGPVLIGSQVSIGENARITGPVVIGPGCSVGEKAVVETAIIWEGVHIKDDTLCQRRVISNSNQLR